MTFFHIIRLTNPEAELRGTPGRGRWRSVALVRRREAVLDAQAIHRRADAVLVVRRRVNCAAIERIYLWRQLGEFLAHKRKKAARGGRLQEQRPPPYALRTRIARGHDDALDRAP